MTQQQAFGVRGGPAPEWPRSRQVSLRTLRLTSASLNEDTSWCRPTGKWSGHERGTCTSSGTESASILQLGATACPLSRAPFSSGGQSPPGAGMRRASDTGWGLVAGTGDYMESSETPSSGNGPCEISPWTSQVGAGRGSPPRDVRAAAPEARACARPRLSRGCARRS